MVLASSSCSSIATSNIDTEIIQDMEALKSQYRLPSLSVAIGRGKEIVFTEAIGLADVNANKNADQNTQYSVGSLAKPMTGIALAKLFDRGLLDLKSKVSKYVKEPKYTDLFTVEELAAHIAGIPHDTPERDNAEFVEVKDHICRS